MLRGGGGHRTSVAGTSHGKRPAAVRCAGNSEFLPIRRESKYRAADSDLRRLVSILVENTRLKHFPPKNPGQSKHHSWLVLTELPLGNES